MTDTEPTSWQLFTGLGRPVGDWQVPPPLPWHPRRADEAAAQAGNDLREPMTKSALARGRAYKSAPLIVQMVNAALHLRRPLLITGGPGSGKSSLVDAVAYEMGLGQPLVWPVTSRSTLRDGLYTYDAIGRVQSQDEQRPAGDFVELGPLGTAMLPALRPRALLIDEIDKADIDLPNDLLNVIEEGRFHIPELSRLKDAPQQKVRLFGSAQEATLTRGVVESHEFPFVVMTSNDERDFPAPFLRRCLQLRMPDPAADKERLRDIVQAHLGDTMLARADELISRFASRAQAGEVLATDQLLNTLQLVMGGYAMDEAERQAMITRLTAALARSA